MFSGTATVLNARDFSFDKRSILVKTAIITRPEIKINFLYFQFLTGALKA